MGKTPRLVLIMVKILVCSGSTNFVSCIGLWLVEPGLDFVKTAAGHSHSHTVCEIYEFGLEELMCDRTMTDFVPSQLLD